MGDLNDPNKNLNEHILKLQKEIDAILVERPHLVHLQEQLKEEMDKCGSPDTEEGRLRRAQVAFEMMNESFKKLQKCMQELEKEINELSVKKRRSHLRLVK
jgi:hypothetical protein